LKIILICLYPNATRILQPADVAVLKPLKSGWGKLMSKWKAENVGQSFTVKDFCPMLTNAVSNRFVSQQTIQNGFRACGLYPFNSNQINYSKLFNQNYHKLQ
jgi:hypothetical protein